MKNTAIIFLWVIHLSALVGLAAGYESFFLEKSPFTMLYLTLIMAVFYPIKDVKKVALFFSFVVIGMSVEWLGVHTGLLFGDYSYGNNFGPKLDGIPYLIGINWALLTFATHQIASKWLSNRWVKSALGAGLMVFLDFFLEQICDYAGFWSFVEGAGWFNYICWFIIAYLLHLILSFYSIKGDFKISFHLYIVQLFFAFSLWILIATT